MSKLGKITLLGLGNMGEALLTGLLGQGVAEPDTITGVEVNVERAEAIAERHEINVEADAKAACKDAEIVVLAVKPQDADTVLAQAGDLSGKMLVSICAGLTLDFLKTHAAKATVVRVMPNTPALVGVGASVYCTGDEVSEEECAKVETLLGAVGMVRRVTDETLMDAVTGLSGSGPAFVFLFLEALADGGVAAGLPRELARALATQTVLGAAALAGRTGIHTAELKDRVCSPAGTTIAGVRVLEGAGLRTSVIEAVVAAAERSWELGD